MVVVPRPSPTGTGLGDAVIVAVDASGLAVGACASGAFGGLHAKKNSGMTTAAVRMNCFIMSLFVEFLEPASLVNPFR
jgi:hypothetical protein